MEDKEKVLSWAVTKIWNDSIDFIKPDRVLKPREHMWATELGGSYIDRYLKMTAVKPTNPPNRRSLRKFEAGDHFEDIVRFVLSRAGLVIWDKKQSDEQRLLFQYEGLIEVSGRLDIYAGGVPDWDKAERELDRLEDLEIFESFSLRARRILEHFKSSYKGELKKIIIEVKSCSDRMFEYYSNYGPSDHHVLQAYHYLKAMDMDEAHIVYICRADLRLMEFGVFNPSPIETAYRESIEKMTYYIRNKIQPEKEQHMVVWNDVAGKFKDNWRVKYSSYLTYLYTNSQGMPFETQADYEDEVRPKVSRWNRVVTRCVNEDNMTANNLQVIEEIEKEYPEFKDYVEVIKSKNKLKEKQS